MKKNYLASLTSFALFSFLILSFSGNAQDEEFPGDLDNKKVEICTGTKQDTIVSTGVNCPEGSEHCTPNHCH
ncbi:MAG: hypothetical protein J0I32_09565 [Sphingobacteriales bacterium]|nr:hypothetical protein [Sphingobacteriales bacterium]OJW00247.1 MAG: hypothetical protein BGO52_03940 [Sphingobacteriales bacterium 44-61]